MSILKFPIKFNYHKLILPIIIQGLFIILPIFTQAQTTPTAIIKGKIKNDKGEPLAFAYIILDTLSKGTASDLDGNYLLEVPEGNYVITAKSIGYKSVSKKIQAKAGNSYTLNFSLQEDTEGMEEVIITGKSKTKELIESGFAVNVIDTKDASTRNLQTNELLDRAVGIKVRQNGGLGSSVEYNLNGMTGRSVGIFINGIEISTYGSSFNLNNIPPAMIERIEVYKGVLPAHLAGDYLGGAINIILKGDLSGNNLSISTSYGSFNTSQTDVSGMYRHKKTGLTARASMFFSYSDNDYKVWGRFVRNTLPDGTMVNVTAKRFNDAFKTYGLRAEAGYTKVKWADEFMISYNHSFAYKEIQHGQYMTKPYMGRFTRSHANVIGLNYTKRNFLTQGIHFKFNGIYSDREQYVQDTVSWNYNWFGEKMIGFHGKPIKTASGAQQGEPTMITINQKIATLRTSLSYDFHKNHRVTLNYLFYAVDRNENDEIKHVAEKKYTSTSDLFKNVTSLSYETQFIKGRLKNNLFIKHYNQKIDRISPYADPVTREYMEDHIKDSRGVFGYGLASSYSLFNNVILLGSAEKAVRMPSEQEIFGGPAENIVANTELKPEMSHNINLGLRLGYFKINRHRFLFAGTFFTRNVRDKITLKSEDRLVNENVQLMPFVNLGLAQSIGFESEISYIYHEKLNITFATSKFNSLFKLKYDPETGKPLSRYNTQIPNEPFFTINTSIQYRIVGLIQNKSVLNINYYFGYVHPFNTIWIYSEKTMTPPQYIQDVGFSYRFPNQKVILSFDIKNIFNRELYDNFAVQKPGRAYYVKLNYTINKFKL
ncbi:MAG TPA: TonB-dependent receptor [Cytophagaceae bacterium]